MAHLTTHVLDTSSGKPAAGMRVLLRGVILASPAFFDVVPVRFAVAAGRDYHLPLLISPYGYSTYRGS